MSSSRFGRRVLAAALPTVLLLAACGDDSDTDVGAEAIESESDGPTVSFAEPVDGATIAGAVRLVMEATGLTIEPAGEVHEGAGHFHVIADEDCVAPGAAVGKDADHVHFGKGQTEGFIYLGPGPHELCLQAGDGAHVALDVTDKVSVEIGVGDRTEWCGVAKAVDELFTQTDTAGEEFAVRQVSYVNITRLIAQLLDGLDQVDSEVRDDVRTALETGSAIAQTFVDAADPAAAEAALMEIYGAEGVQSDGPGATWILDNCQVDIDG